MKKLYLLFFLFNVGLLQGQQLVNAYLEQTPNPNLVILHTAVYHNYYSTYADHTIDYQNNIINFNLCYSNSSALAVIYETREFTITIPNGNPNYILNLNFFTWNQNMECDYNNSDDQVTIDFALPYNPSDKIFILDANFEGYLEAKGFGDGITNNNLVYTHKFINLSHLWMNLEDLSILGLSQIEDLTGIEMLYRLKRLYCENNLISNFDATLHPLLEQLVITNNPIQLLEVHNSPNLINLQAALTQIGNVDLSSNPMLSSLGLGSPNIDEIDVSNNSALWKLFLRGTNISNIDLTNNLILESLNLQENPLLEHLSLESNSNLNSFTCEENQSMESIIFGVPQNLSTIICNNNESLEILDVMGCKNLTFLMTQFNSNLTSLNFSGNPLLETLIINSNNLHELDLRNGNTTTLTLILGFDNPDLFCIKVDDPAAAPYGQWIFDNEVIYDIDCTDPIINIPDPNFKNALVNSPVVDTTGNGLGDSVADLNGDGEIQLSEAQAVEGLIISYYEISSLEGIQYFVNLETLKSRSNFHTSINLSQNTKLKWLHVESTPLEALDVSQNPLLEKVWVYQNQLTSFDVSQNPNLESLRVYTNPLSFLNIKNGNNEQITNFLAYDTPNLNCIKVDDVDFANSNPNWIKDEHTVYGEECLLQNQEFTLEKDIIIYPNPATEIINIQIIHEPYLLEVYDVSGKKVVSQSDNLKELLVNGFENGLYFMKLYFAEGTFVKPFIKK